MDEVNKNILLVSYVFPPYYGIGGRRWAKHALQLSKSGFTIHVICAKNPYDKTSLWLNSIQKNKNIVLHILPAKYPDCLVNNDSSFFSKLKYRFWINVLPLFTKLNYYDRSVFWQSGMLNTAEALIRQYNIKKIICSGGPFHAMVHVLKLKKNFHDIFILNDLRDPWTWATNWGFPSLNKQRLSEEQKMEREMVEQSDIISVPTEGMLKHLYSKYPEQMDKFIKLPHVFDEAEIPVKHKIKSEKLRLVYYGTIYEGIQESLEEVFRLMKAYEQKITLDIYTDSEEKLKELRLKYKTDNVFVFKPVATFDLFNKFENYDFVLMINPLYNIHNISTKFYEIIYSRTPIILISEQGSGPEFIKQNNLGLVVKANDFENEVSKIISGNSEFKYNSNFDVSEFSLEAVTKQLEKYLK